MKKLFVIILSLFVGLSLVACKHEHEFGEWQCISPLRTSCEQREYEQKCACGEKNLRNGSEDDHDFEVETIAPSCTDEGYDVLTCKICGKNEITNIKPIEAHQLSQEYTFDSFSHWHCCENCSYSTETTAHSLNDSGFCTECNNQINSTAGLTFTDCGRYYEISGYSGTERNVVIVNLYNNKPVKSIGDNAFSDCTFLESIQIPESVTDIGFGAFARCTNLVDITVSPENKDYKSIDGNLYSKDEKTLIQYALGKTDTSFTVPESVESIAEEAFAYCSNLENVIIGNNVADIGTAAFMECASLSYNEYDNAYYLGNDHNPYLVLIKAISGDITFCEVNSETRIIYGGAFASTDIEDIVMPDSIKFIGEKAFYDCRLKGVYYMGSESEWDSIDVGAYNSINRVYYYSEIELCEYGDYWHYDEDDQVSIWPKVTEGLEFTINSIGTAYSVTGAKNAISDLVVPKHHNGLPVVSIGDSAFREQSIGTVRLPDTIALIGDYAFYGCDFLHNIELGDGLRNIGRYAFAYCTNLTESIKIPDGVSALGEYAFEGCESLWVVEMGSIETIGAGAFKGCTEINEIVLSSVTSIGSRAFTDCERLDVIYYLGTSTQWLTQWSLNIEKNNEPLYYARRYYYSKNEPISEGDYWHYDENGEIVKW